MNSSVKMMSVKIDGNNSCDEEHNQAWVDKGEDYMEYEFCGNNAMLFIRERTISDCRSLKDSKYELNDSYIKAPIITETHTPTEPLPAPSKLKTTSVLKEDFKTSHYRCLQMLDTRKWSGKTYFEEVLRQFREEEYRKDLNEAIKRRRLWKDFQKDLARDRKLDLVRTAGPKWWQEPSPKQIHLALSLDKVIKADYEETVTGRTRQWLLDLGVTTRLSPKQVKSCMKCSLLDPVDFLLEAHEVVLKLQLKVQKKKSSPGKTFSINERILLSAVCVLELPTLFTMLNYILPPPEDCSESKYIQELIYGDVNDKRIRYSTPYMEPLPFRSLDDFNSWAFDKVFRALLPSISPTRKTMKTMSTLKMSVFDKARSEKPVTSSDEEIYTRKLSDISTTPSISWLISHCMNKRRNLSPSMIPFTCDKSEKRFFSRRLTINPHFSQKQKDPSTEKTDSIQITKQHSSTNITLLEEESVDTSGNITSHFPLINHFGKTPSSHKSSYTGNNQDEQNNVEVSKGFERRARVSGNHLEPLPSEYQHREFQDRSKQKLESPTLKGNIITNKIKGIKEGASEEIYQKQLALDNAEFENIWGETRALPKNKQLKHAIKILAEMGDPLAQLPGVHKLPSVLRWLELRRGENRILTKKTKEKLLRKSKRLWMSGPAGFSKKGPKLECSKSEERLLTWDKKNWLQSEVKKEMQNYYTRMKQEKVDNARLFFPTMLNNYDYGSNLNRHFREVFFTYLPAREADTFVYRPWRP